MVGDIVVLQTGNIVPADMRVVSSTSMKADKSLLTGEAYPMRYVVCNGAQCKCFHVFMVHNRVMSEPVAETVSYLEAKNILFMGYHIVDGNGIGLVLATGRYTQVGSHRHSDHHILH